MRGALVILIAMVVIGVILFVTDVIFYRRNGKELGSHRHGKGAENGEQGTGNREQGIGNGEPEPEVCCGMHLVCEKTGLSPVSDEIVYYDDEELDRFKGRESESYSPEETEEFRDVLMTLLPEDVAGWARSITLREIALPPEVRDELLMIVSDLRH